MPHRLCAPLALTILISACGPAEEQPLDPEPLVDEEAFLTSEGKADQVLPGKPTRYPILLLHGFAASPTRNGFHGDIVRALCADRHQVYVTAVPPFQPVPDRARALAAQVDAILAGRGQSACAGRPAARADKVNLIAHSMGGLDARYLVGRLGYGGRVASIMTISTPHRGSAITDMLLGFLGGVDDEALNAFAKLVGRGLSTAELAADPQLKAALLSLSESAAASFNASVRNDGRVYYESWAGLSNVAGVPNPKDRGACDNKLLGFRLGGLRHVMHIALKPIAAVVAHGASLIPNDALVRIDSAKWGNFRGCIPADHADEIGAFGSFSWSAFQYAGFYRLRAFELAQRGY